MCYMYEPKWSDLVTLVVGSTAVMGYHLPFRRQDNRRRGGGLHFCEIHEDRALPY